MSLILKTTKLLVKLLKCDFLPVPVTALSPNLPQLLSNYQIYMGFSHFHEIGIFSRIDILAPHQTSIRKNEVLKLKNNINLILIFFYQLILILEDGNNVYLIYHFYMS